MQHQSRSLTVYNANLGMSGDSLYHYDTRGVLAFQADTIAFEDTPSPYSHSSNNLRILGEGR